MFLEALRHLMISGTMWCVSCGTRRCPTWEVLWRRTMLLRWVLRLCVGGVLQCLMLVTRLVGDSGDQCQNSPLPMRCGPRRTWYDEEEFEDADFGPGFHPTVGFLTLPLSPSCDEEGSEEEALPLAGALVPSVASLPPSPLPALFPLPNDRRSRRPARFRLVHSEALSSPEDIAAANFPRGRDAGAAADADLQRYWDQVRETHETELVQALAEAEERHEPEPTFVADPPTSVLSGQGGQGGAG